VTVTKVEKISGWYMVKS